MSHILWHWWFFNKYVVSIAVYIIYINIYSLYWNQHGAMFFNLLGNHNIMELKNYRLKSLDDIKYPRLCDIWNTGVSFVIPSKSELMKRVAIQKTPKFKVMIHLFCTDGIERVLDFDTLRNYVIECDEHLNKTGNIVTPCTKFYKKCSMTKSARELFELIAGYCGHTIKVIDVKHVYTNYHNSLITICLPCFEIMD